MKLDARAKLFVFLAGLFITSLLVGDLIGGKLYEFELGGLELGISVGMIPFPIVFLLTDLINEFYGKKAARFVTLVGFVMAWFTILVLQLATMVPWPESPFHQAFDAIFASSQKILFASTVAYLTAQLVDITVFHFLKRKLHGRFLWLRATGSTVVSQLIDTFIINFLVWSSQKTPGQILGIIGTSYVTKVAVAIALTPFIYAGHALVERGLKLGPAGIEDS
ncbi:MAG TPA: queuosine precursor transporter [Kofleriaceae bacterium]|nr:queuosine precursor transporter [Kofleriaceae bacterium]